MSKRGRRRTTAARRPAARRSRSTTAHKPTAREQRSVFKQAVRVHTGVHGLDSLMDGGFRRSSINLVGGGAGTGKSIFGMQFLLDGIRHGEAGIYITFEEDPDKVIEDFRSFGWDLQKHIDNKMLAILFYTPQQVGLVIESGGGIVRDTIEAIKARRLVLDSLTAFTLLYDEELSKRKAVLQLFENAHKWGVTSLMTSQQEQEPETHLSNVLEFETDCVIILYNTRDGHKRVRRIEIFKMRGSPHANKLMALIIDRKGMRLGHG